MKPTRRLVERVLAAGGALWAGLVLSRPLAENDLFWHLMLGRAVARAGARTVPEPSAMPSLPPLVVVPEWLWDVLAWQSARVGPGLLTGFVMACGAAAAALTVHLLCVHARRVPWPFVLGVAGLVLAAASVRYRERPETLALALAAAVLLLGRAVVRRPRAPIIAALVVVTFLWAQVHGTFVLALPLFLACALEARPRARRGVAVAAGLVALCLATGPHGASITGFLQQHLAGDAVRHIGDMAAPAWDDFDPTRQPFLFIAVILAVLALGPACFGITRRAPLALALFGLALGALSVRAVSLTALCLVPQLGLVLRWAARRTPRWLPGVTALAGVLALVGVTVRFESRVGPFFAFEYRATELPREAVEALRALPAGSVTWTSYVVGAAVGYLADGHLRVTIDSRTPLHFGDGEFALSRDCRSNAACFARAAQVLQVDAAVVERGEECFMLARHGDFVPVAVNARYATFARARFGLPTLTTIDVCAPLFLSATACDAAFETELSRLAPAGEDFTKALRGMQQLKCGGRVDARELEALLTRSARWPALQTTVGQAWLRANEPARAVERLLPPAQNGFAPSIPLLHEALSKSSAEARREPLERFVAAMDDRTPAPFRALRAITAAELDDADVAAFEAVRAAAAGEKSVVPVLRALAIDAPGHPQAGTWKAWAELLERAQ